MMGNTKRVIFIQHIKNKSPKEILFELRSKYPMMYIHRDGGIVYQGYDISDINDSHPIAEVLLVDNTPVQVRYLKSKPFWRESLKFGDF